MGAERKAKINLSEDAVDFPDRPKVELKPCASHLGCQRLWPLPQFNLSAGVCNDCANRIAGRLGIGYEEVGAAIVAHRFMDWYTERHSEMEPLTSRQKVRVMILASDPGAVVNHIEAFERAAAASVRADSTYLKGGITPTTKSIPVPYKRQELARRIPPALEGVLVGSEQGRVVALERGEAK